MSIFVPPMRGIWAGGAGSGAAEAFDPTSVPNLVQWFSARDTSTMLDAGGNPADDGEAIATWLDKSGDLRHASQATAGQRPTRVSVGIGGQESVNFSGTQGLDHAYALGAPACTIFIVTDVGSGAKIYEIAYSTQGTGSGQIAYFARLGINFPGTYNGGDQRSDTTLQGYGKTLRTIIRASGGGVTFRTDSAADGTATGAVGDAGSTGRVGGFPGGTQGLTGRIAEIIVYDRALTAGEIDYIEAGLSEIYAVGLPSYVLFAGGQSNATAEWASSIESRLRVLAGHNRIHVVNESYGGSHLYQWYDAGPQALYDLDLAAVEAALAVYGSGAVFAGLFWMQGETDSNDDSLIADYATRFPDFMGQWETDLSLGADVKYCICLTSYNTSADYDTDAELAAALGSASFTHARMEDLRAVQLTLGEAAAGAYVDSRPYTRYDVWHITGGSPTTTFGSQCGTAWYLAHGPLA